MASEVIENEAVLKGASDTSWNNSSLGIVTPSRTREDLGSRQTSSPSSSGVSGEAGDQEGSHELRVGTTSAVENGEEGFQGDLTKTRGTPQGRTEKLPKQSGGRSSTPVSLPQPRSPPGPTGRSVFWSLADRFDCDKFMISHYICFINFDLQNTTN